MRAKKYKDNMMVINFNSHKMPEFKEVMGKDWVYYGEKNDYPQFLLDLYYKCSKHNAIVKGKCEYIAGAGWSNSGEIPINTDGETLNSFTKKTVLDCEIHNGEAIEVIWMAGGKYAEFRHIDFAKIRSNADNSEFYYTSEWLNKQGYPNQTPQRAKDWEVYEPFDPNNRKGKQLIYYKNYSPGLDVYPLPEYKAAMLYIELEYQIANYWYNRVKNGFMPSAILNFYMGQPTDDEMKKLEEKIKGKFTGTNNAGQFILNFAPNKDSAADIQQIRPPELSQEYEALNKTLQTEIFTGHRVTNGMLFGIKEAGQLGGRTELIESNELFQNRYVSPRQLEKEMFFAKYIFPYVKGIKGDMKLLKQEPIGFQFSESTMVKFLPQRAITEMIALKMGVDMKKYPEHEQEQKDRKEQEQQFSKEESISPCVKKLMDEGKSQKQAVAICISKRERGMLDEFKLKAKKRKGKELKSRPVTYEMSRDLKASEDEMTFEFKDNPKVIVGRPTVPIDVKITPTPTEIIYTVYRYDWIEGFSDSNLDTSREFCKDMIEMSRDGFTWTREDIESISTAGYPDTWDGEPDIWAQRGGWWNKNGVAVPSCRHQWIQVLIKETI